jgi:hypothetical protein
MTDVVVVGYDGAELVDIACVTSAFRMANERGARPGYRICLATADGKPIIVEGALPSARSGPSGRSAAPTR